MNYATAVDLATAWASLGQAMDAVLERVGSIPLRAIVVRRAGYRLHEMGRFRENSFCCGAGGDRIWMDDSVSVERPSENRIREALALGDVDAFVVACPKDTVMYSAAVQALGVGDRIVVRDMIDLVRTSSTVA